MKELSRESHINEAVLAVTGKLPETPVENFFGQVLYPNEAMQKKSRLAQLEISDLEYAVLLINLKLHSNPGQQYTLELSDAATEIAKKLNASNLPQLALMSDLHGITPISMPDSQGTTLPISWQQRFSRGELSLRTTKDISALIANEGKVGIGEQTGIDRLIKGFGLETKTQLLRSTRELTKVNLISTPRDILLETTALYPYLTRVQQSILKTINNSSNPSASLLSDKFDQNEYNKLLAILGINDYESLVSFVAGLKRKYIEQRNPTGAQKRIIDPIEDTLRWYAQTQKPLGTEQSLQEEIEIQTPQSEQPTLIVSTKQEATHSTISSESRSYLIPGMYINITVGGTTMKRYLTEETLHEIIMSQPNIEYINGTYYEVRIFPKNSSLKIPFKINPKTLKKFKVEFDLEEMIKRPNTLTKYLLQRPEFVERDGKIYRIEPVFPGSKVTRQVPVDIRDPKTFDIWSEE